MTPTSIKTKPKSLQLGDLVDLPLPIILATFFALLTYGIEKRNTHETYGYILVIITIIMISIIRTYRV